MIIGTIVGASDMWHIWEGEMIFLILIFYYFINNRIMFRLNFHNLMTLTKKLATSVTMFALLAVFAAPTVSFADHGSIYHELSAIAFDDANGNGIFDCDESGIAGVRIQLSDEFGLVLDEIHITDENGIWMITGLSDGTYSLKVIESPLGVILDGSTQTFVMDSDRSVYFGSPSGYGSATCNGDVTPPVITLNGPNPQELIINQVYEEFRATVTDDSGEGLSGALVIDSSYVIISQEGSYQVSYDVTDSSSNAADTVFRTVNVITPQQALDKIEQEINEIPEGDIGNNANGLLAKLGQIMDKLDANNTNAACNQLNAFINQIEDLIISGDLSSEIGQPILDAANTIHTNYC